MKNLFFFAFATCFLLFSTSCATLFTGTTGGVNINSKPPGAKIQVNGIDRGTTPSIVKLRRDNEGPIVTLKMDGYQNRTFQPETTFNEIAILNLFSPLHWAIDFLSGALWKFDPVFYELELEK